MTTNAWAMVGSLRLVVLVLAIVWPAGVCLEGVQVALPKRMA